MPLVDQTGFVACGFQYGGEGGIGGQDVGSAHNGGIAFRINFVTGQSAGCAGVVADGCVARVLACHQGAAGWRTDSRTGIALRESGSRFG